MAQTVLVRVLDVRHNEIVNRFTTLQGDAEKYCPGGTIDGLRILKVTWSADRKCVDIEAS